MVKFYSDFNDNHQGKDNWNKTVNRPDDKEHWCWRLQNRYIIHLPCKYLN